MSEQTSSHGGPLGGNRSTGTRPTPPSDTHPPTHPPRGTGDPAVGPHLGRSRCSPGTRPRRLADVTGGGWAVNPDVDLKSTQSAQHMSAQTPPPRRRPAAHDDPRPHHPGLPPPRRGHPRRRPRRRRRVQEREHGRQVRRPPHRTAPEHRRRDAPGRLSGFTTIASVRRAGQPANRPVLPAWCSAGGAVGWVRTVPE